MRRYYVNGKEISEKEAEKIKEKNKKYLNSKDWTRWEKVEFIVVSINKQL